MGRSLYVLTEPEKLALGSVRSMGSSVVAAGPWIKGTGELPHRVVLRDDGREFIVHLQVIDTDLGHAFYTHGNYFPCPHAIVPGRPLADAWTRFEDRVRRCLDIPARPEPAPQESDDDQVAYLAATSDRS